MASSKRNRILGDLTSQLHSKVRDQRGIFKLFDKDNDGVINKEEFSNVLTNFDVCSKDEAGKVFTSMLKNPDGNVLSFSDLHKNLEFKSNQEEYTRPKKLVKIPVLDQNLSEASSKGLRSFRQSIDIVI